LDERTLDLRLGEPLIFRFLDSAQHAPHELVLEVLQDGHRLLHLQHRADGEKTPEPKTAGPPSLASIDELVQIASYLEQYRNATRSPLPYWTEVLSRDPDETRAAAAVGARLYDSADYQGALEFLARRVRRRTRRAPAPTDGTAHYRLGLTLARIASDADAALAFARAAWDAQFAVPARYALARHHAKNGRRDEAVRLLREVVVGDPQHLQAADLLALLLRTLGPEQEAQTLLAGTLSSDPLDHCALHLSCGSSTTDATVALDVALEYAGAGFSPRHCRHCRMRSRCFRICLLTRFRSDLSSPTIAPPCNGEPDAMKRPKPPRTGPLAARGRFARHHALMTSTPFGPFWHTARLIPSLLLSTAEDKPPLLPSLGQSRPRGTAPPARA
jgi:tetratricopeptide (TPR) repeat protein